MESLTARIQPLREALAQRLESVNCHRNIKFPISYSLQSVDLLPCQKDSGLVAITLKHCGQVRVVHGCQEIFNDVAEAFGKECVKEEEAKEEEEESNQKQVWTLETGAETFKQKEGLEALCKVMQSLIKRGWEIVTSGQFTTTPGFELGTWILKKTSTVLNNVEVACIAFHDDGVGDDKNRRAKVEVVGDLESGQVRNVVKQATEKMSETNRKQESVEKNVDNDENQRKDEGEDEKSAKQQKRLSMGKDDPNCPDTFFLVKEENQLDLSKFILEVTHLLFCRQWKLISTIQLPYGEGGHETLIFCRDGRILPALAQEPFAMIHMEKPDLLRLYHMTEDMEREVKNVIKEHWTHGMESCKDTTSTLKLGGNPWTRIKEESTPMLSAPALVAQLILALNSKELNFYAKISYDCLKDSKKTLLIFRHSNVSFARALTLQPRGLNKLGVLGASDEDLETIRNVFKDRWPYPLTRDFVIPKLEGLNTKEWQMLKVKRYPWIVSYGNKHADKVIEAAKELMSQRQIQTRIHVDVPPPTNMDSDSAKSLLIYLIKDLSELGWRLQLCADITSDMHTPLNKFVARPTNANAMIFLT